MENTTFIAGSRQMSLWRQLDVVANNMANMSTHGYKAEKMLFAEHLMDSKNSERAFPQQLSYVLDFGTLRDLSTGPLEHTGNPLDIAIEGEGYFTVEGANGPLYTRNGRFTRDLDGGIVTSDGYPVLSDAGEPLFIAPTETDIRVAVDGTVSTENGVIGKMAIVDFEDPQAMKRVTSGLYSVEEGVQPITPDTARVQQGMVEKSNVNPMLEMTEMIRVQRAFEATNKLIEDETERQQKALRALSGAQSN
ncbi:MAG: flagellar basal-body rod protein FlgF [Rhodospirillaceae bacterium]